MSENNNKMQKASSNDLRALLESAAPKLAEVAPKHMKVERLVRLLLAASMKTPKILECTKESVLSFAMKCSETGLEPIGAGGAWAIPYENRKAGTVELQFIPDYRGLVHCAKQSGCIKDAYAEVVRANDEFDYELGLDPKLFHKPARGDRGDLESAYCVVVLPDGTKRFSVMDASEVEAIRKRSRAGSSGPWVTDTAEMWKKTITRRAMKPFSGASQELDAAISADNDNFETNVTGTGQIAMPQPKSKKELPPTKDEAAPAVEQPPADDAGTEPPPKADESTPTQPADDTGATDNRIETIVESVKEGKRGKNPKTGKDWQIYEIKCSDDHTYKTFDSKLAGGVQQGDAVMIEFEEDKYGRTITALTVL